MSMGTATAKCFLRFASLLIGVFYHANAHITHEEQTMLDWIRQEGGEFKVTIGRNAAGVRGVFTTEDVRKGDVLIQVPDHLVFSVRNVPASEGAPHLLKELFTPCTRLRPYWNVMPTETEVLTGYNFPEEYIKYLGDDQLEQQVMHSFKKHCHTTYMGQNNENMDVTIVEAIGSRNISLAHWEYVVSMLTSRTFSLRKAALSMVPLLDLMNHDIRDINRFDESDARGVRLIAGKDLARGEEVTITYGNMRADETLLFYGFVDRPDGPPRLLSVDHRKYKPYDYAELNDDNFTGTPEELDAEMNRLKDILKNFEARLLALGPIPDTVPYVAGLLRSLHEHRRAALEHEMGRLQQLLHAQQATEV